MPSCPATVPFSLSCHVRASPRGWLFASHLNHRSYFVPGTSLPCPAPRRPCAARGRGAVRGVEKSAVLRWVNAPSSPAGTDKPWCTKVPLQQRARPRVTMTLGQGTSPCKTDAESGPLAPRTVRLKGRRLRKEKGNGSLKSVRGFTTSICTLCRLRTAFSPAEANCHAVL